MFNQISIVSREGQTFARIAKVLEQVALSTGVSHLLETGPIVVCTRNDDLESVLEWIPFERRLTCVYSKWYAADMVY